MATKSLEAPADIVDSANPNHRSVIVDSAKANHRSVIVGGTDNDKRRQKGVDFVRATRLRVRATRLRVRAMRLRVRAIRLRVRAILYDGYNHNTPIIYNHNLIMI